jgi:hypothetical protein
MLVPWSAGKTTKIEWLCLLIMLFILFFIVVKIKMSI